MLFSYQVTVRFLQLPDFVIVSKLVINILLHPHISSFNCLRYSTLKPTSQKLHSTLSPLSIFICHALSSLIGWVISACVASHKSHLFADIFNRVTELSPMRSYLCVQPLSPACSCPPGSAPCLAVLSTFAASICWHVVPVASLCGFALFDHLD